MNAADAHMTEAQMHEAIRTAAGLAGWWLYHTYDSRRSNPGFPDLVLVHPRRRRVLFVELKTATGRVSLAQADWMDALREAGAEAYVWRPADLDRVLGDVLGELAGGR